MSLCQAVAHAVTRNYTASHNIIRVKCDTIKASSSFLLTPPAQPYRNRTRPETTLFATTTRSLSSSSSSSSADITTTSFPDAVIHSRGDMPYGSREYLLLPPHVELADLTYEPSLLIASIRAHRNILFDCRIHLPSSNDGIDSSVDETNTNDYRLSQVCLPLVQAALQNAGADGEQPQAMSTLHGLSSWVVDCLEGRCESKVLNNLLAQEKDDLEQKSNNKDDDNPSAASISLGAVRAMATGIPRPGHSVVGVGTYRDGQMKWQALAKEYVHLSAATTSTTSSSADDEAVVIVSEEAQLYQAAGGQLVSIEYLADKQPDYLKSAGGAMARFFFL